MLVSIFIIAFFQYLIISIGAKKAFFAFFIYSFIDSGYSVVGPISLEVIILFLFFVHFVFVDKERSKGKYIFKICTLCTVGSYFISTFLSPYPHLPMTIIRVFSIFLPSYLMFHYIRNGDDINRLINMMIVLVYFLFLYSIFELAIGSSPIIDFINDHNEAGYNLDDIYRYGIKRVQGTFTHATGLAYFAVVITAFLLLYVNGLIKSKTMKLRLNIAVFFLIVIVFLTGTRSCIVPLVVILAYNLKERVNKVVIVLFIAVMIIVIPYVLATSTYFSEMFNSIVDTDTDAVGSSQSMREEQFMTSLSYMLQRFWIGWGYGMTFEHVTPIHPEMFGAESAWMPIMIDRGFLGCLTYLVCYVEVFWRIKKEFFKSLFFVLVLLFINTSTSTPGLDESFFLCMTVIIYKIYTRSNHDKVQCYSARI